MLPQRGGPKFLIQLDYGDVERRLLERAQYDAGLSRARGLFNGERILGWPRYINLPADGNVMDDELRRRRLHLARHFPG